MFQQELAVDPKSCMASLQSEANKDVPIVAPGKIFLLQPRVPPGVPAIANWTRTWLFVEKSSAPARARRCDKQHVKFVVFHSADQCLLHGFNQNIMQRITASVQLGHGQSHALAGAQTVEAFKDI